MVHKVLGVTRARRSSGQPVDAAVWP